MNYRRYSLLFGLAMLIGIVGLFPTPPSSAASSLSNIELIVSLEWQPSTLDMLRDAYGNKCGAFTKANFVSQLTTALEETSADVYGYTDGQVWISKYQVYANGEHWNDADIRILVNANFRPTAYLGGFEDTVREIHTSDGRTVTFAPGSIFLGRLWNGVKAECGFWDAPAGVSTIAHELGHHILGLGDGYAPNPKTNSYDYCSSTSADLPNETTPSDHNSLMSYQYTAARLRGDDGEKSYGCENTPHTQLYHQSDWKTAQVLYGLIPPASDAGFPSPSRKPIVDVFISYSRDVGYSMVSAEELKGEALAFSMHGSMGNPVRMLEQGVISRSSPEAWLGIEHTVDWPLLVARDWSSDAIYGAKPNPLHINTTNSLALVKADWAANLVVKPIVSTQSGSPIMKAIKVEGSECLAKSKYVGIALCPAGGPCHDRVTVIPSDGKFSHTFQLTAQEQAQLGAGHGSVYAYSLNYGDPIAISYQVSGGFGPATAEIHAPLADGAASVDIDPTSSLKPDGSTLLVSQSVPACLAPPTSEKIVQWPALIQPFELHPDGAFPWGTKEPNLTAQLAYDPALFTSGPPRVIVYNPAKSFLGWQPLNVVAVSPELGLITVEATTFMSQGMVYALTQ